jgi:hypothetical protein
VFKAVPIGGEAVKPVQSTWPPEIWSPGVIFLLELLRYGLVNGDWCFVRGLCRFSFFAVLSKRIL